jgi:hypothetical protein
MEGRQHPNPEIDRASIEGWRMQLAYLANQLPWEQQRTHMVLNALFAERYQMVNVPIDQHVEIAFSPYAAQMIEMRRQRDVPPHSWLNTTYLLRAFFDELPMIHHILHEVVIREQQRRAILVELALLAHRLEHGNYPETLQELAGDFLREVPNDLFGEGFMARDVTQDRSIHYHPRGLDGWLQLPQGGLVPPGTPLFWIGGTSGNQLTVNDQIGRVPLEHDQSGNVVRSQELEGRPLYWLSQYFVSPERSDTFSIYLLPVPEDAGGGLRTGRDPREDGVGVVPHRMNANVLGGSGAGGYGDYGYGSGVRVPFRTEGDYGEAAAYGTAAESDGLPPGYDLPPLDA